MAEFQFFTNHAHALVCIAQDGDTRIREIAQCVGITERATQRIVAELTEEGYLSHRRVGRRNVYTVHPNLSLRHDLEDGVPIGKVLDTIVPRWRSRAKNAAA
jgi:DNA-binding Lrp family transcriptional regulator